MSLTLSMTKSMTFLLPSFVLFWAFKDAWYTGLLNQCLLLPKLFVGLFSPWSFSSLKSTYSDIWLFSYAHPFISFHVTCVRFCNTEHNTAPHTCTCAVTYNHLSNLPSSSDTKSEDMSRCLFLAIQHLYCLTGKCCWWGNHSDETYSPCLSLEIESQVPRCTNVIPQRCSGIPDGMNDNS